MNSKQFGLRVSEDDLANMTKNPEVTVDTKVSGASKTSGADKPASKAKPQDTSAGVSMTRPNGPDAPVRKVVKAEDRRWKSRAGQVAWEGVKHITGTKNDPQSHILLDEAHASRANALRVGARMTQTSQQYSALAATGKIAAAVGRDLAVGVAAQKIGEAITPITKRIGDKLTAATPQGHKKAGGA